MGARIRQAAGEAQRLMSSRILIADVTAGKLQVSAHRAPALCRHLESEGCYIAPVGVIDR